MAASSAATSLHSRPRRQDGFDLLRLWLAAAVLLSHSPELLDGDRHRELLSRMTEGVMSLGEAAVLGFFAISGFLVMTSWMRQRRLKIYFANRVLRIVPGFVVAYLTSVLLIAPAFSTSPEFYKTLQWGSMLRDVLLLQPPRWLHVFDGQPYPFVNGALWTIQAEFACYAAVAVAGLVCRTHLKSCWIAGTVLLLAACADPAVLAALDSSTAFELKCLVRLAAAFSVGASLALVRFDGVRSPIVVAAIAVALLMVMQSERLATVAYATLGSVLLLSLGIGIRNPLAALKIPDISYGIFLYGWPIQKVLISFMPNGDPWMLFVIALAMAMPCGYVSWILVEKPFLQLGRNWLAASPRPNATHPGISAAEP